MFRSTSHFHRPPLPRARRKDRRTGGPPGATRMPWPPRSSARKTPRYPRRSGRGSQDHLPSSALEAVDHRHLLPPPSLEMFVPWAPTSVHEENNGAAGQRVSSVVGAVGVHANMPRIKHVVLSWRKYCRNLAHGKGPPTVYSIVSSCCQGVTGQGLHIFAQHGQA